MKSYRRFCLIILGIVMALLLYNAVVWHCYTRQLLTQVDGFSTGDLARVGYLSAYTAPRKVTYDLPRRHLDIADWEGEPVDVVTIGDSFSAGGGGGLNPYYQDYLATFSHMNVVNVRRHPGAGSLLENVTFLLNSGLLEQMKPKYLLLEIAERNCHKSAGVIDPARTDNLENIRRFYLGADKTGIDNDDEEAGNILPSVGFINTGNAKWLLYNLLYQLSPNAFFAKTYKLPLTRQLFSADPGNMLLVLRKDIEKTKKYDALTVQALNDNLNRVAGLLKAHGIELVFMPAPDKYTLYRPYLVEKRWPESHFFELLRPLDKKYRFIDTEKVLAAKIAAGEKDVYYLDDTHWSWKASKAIFEQTKLP